MHYIPADDPLLVSRPTMMLPSQARQRSATLPGEHLSRQEEAPCEADLSCGGIRYYPEPKDAAKNIKNYVAFYKVRRLLLAYSETLPWLKQFRRQNKVAFE